MKRHILFLLAAVLGMLNIQPASAQQTQDALYVFRNDGGFNAFFYCDIDHIAYSKVDTLGVEHDDYVTQEIYALDSIFRIPISAIDSVAFVTPEKKYKADVKLYDQTIANYIVASDSVNWFRLAANTPASMIPKKGDKLMIESESTFLPDGIAGLVESVDQSAAGYTVNLGDVVIQDIFETLVIKEGAGLSKTAAARPHENRRAADVTFNPKPIEWGPFEGSFTAQGSKDLITGWKGGIDISADLVGSISYNDNAFTTIRAFIFLNGWGLKFDCYKREDIHYSHIVSIGGAVTARFDLPFQGIIYKDLNPNGFLKLEASWGVFTEGSLSVNANFSDEFSAGSIDNFGFIQNVGDGLSTTLGEVTCNEHRPYSTARKTEYKSLTGKGSLSVGLYGKVGVKLRYRKVKFDVSAGVELGVRAELQQTVDISQLMDATKFKTTAFYRMANFDDAVTLTGFGNFGGSFAIGNGKKISFKPELSSSKGYGVVPNITGIKWTPETKTPWRGKLESPIKRDVFIATSIGFAVYDEEKNKLVEDYWSPVKYAYEASQQKYSQIFDHFNPGVKYWAYPQTTLFGIPILTNNELQFTLGDPYITPEKKEIEYDEAYNFTEMEVITNIANVEFTASKDWISKPTWLQESAELHFDAQPLPNDVNIRKGAIKAVGRDWDGKVIKEDSITITQMRPILKATPSNLEFERIGGTKQVTIETTYDNIEVKKGADYTYPLPFEMKLNDTKTKLTVTVPENTTGMSRNAAIIVTATSKEGKKIQEAIFLTQLAEDTNPYYIKFKDSNLELGQGEDTYELTSECNFNWYYLRSRSRWTINGEDEHRWFTLKQVSYQMVDGKCMDKWNLTVEKNDWGFDRDAQIELLVYDKDSTMTAITTIYFTQIAGDSQTVGIPTKFEVIGVDIDGQANVKWSDGSESSEEWSLWDQTSQPVTATYKNNSLHFNVPLNNETNISFDVVDINNPQEWDSYSYGEGNWRKSYVTNIIYDEKDGDKWTSTDKEKMYYRNYDGIDSETWLVGWLWKAYDGINVDSYDLKYQRDIGNGMTKTGSATSFTIKEASFTLKAYLPNKVSSRRRATQEKQTTTSTEKITRHIER